METESSIEQMKIDIARLDTDATIKVRTLITTLADLIYAAADAPAAGSNEIAVLVDRLHDQEESIALAVLANVASDDEPVA